MSNATTATTTNDIMESSSVSIASVMEDNSGQTEKDAFEEERRLLLTGVAESLTNVLKLMAKANANLHGIDESCTEVEIVAEMWREGYRRDS